MAKEIAKGRSSPKMKVRTVSWKELKSDTKNWFRYIAVTDGKLVRIFNRLARSPKLSTLSSLANPVRGFEMEKGAMQSLILNREDRALRSKDVWVIDEEDKDIVRFRHKDLPERFEVPKNCVIGALRRSSGVNRINVTELLDYVVVERGWKDFERFKELSNSEPSSETREKVERRLGNVLISWRLNLSAPGTHLLAFYAAKYASPSKMFWSIKLSDENDAKILTLFLNSTFNLLQYLLSRVETEGAFIEIFKYILEDFYVLDPRKLTTRRRKYLLRVFDKVKNKEFPSILQQLEEECKLRKKIDRAVMKALNMRVSLKRLYKGLAEEIRALKELMEGGA